MTDLRDPVPTGTAPLSVEDVPGPHPLPVLGNVFAIERGDPLGGFVRMAAEYGPIFKVVTPSMTRLMVSGPELVDELCDDSRFDKALGGGLATLQASAFGSGLFTANTADPLWRRAHDILMSPFSQQSMRDYMPKMVDIADQLMEKWARLNPGEEVDVAADMTRLTLDTIALCGFGYRFNSFYRDTPHPFVDAMVRSLTESQARMRQLPIQTRLRVRAHRQMVEDEAYMSDLVDGIIAARRAQGGAMDTSDLLGKMLTGVEKSTGLGLPDENIRAQCITFLVAGHGTTSGLLAFAVYYLMKNPDVLARARAEVDDVLGSTAEPTFEQVHRLTYVRQILDETLRLWPTAPGFTRTPVADTVLGGYLVHPGTPITVLAQALHRAPSVWGPDAAEFDPDHTAPERMAGIPPNAYKPFGSGLRACIGRQFALQEAILVLGMLVQRFDVVDHLHYELRTKTSLTVKPDDFHVLVRPREGVRIERSSAAQAAPPVAAEAAPALRVARHGTPLSVLFGSNLGTAESIATRLAQEGTERGFAVTLGALDDHVDDLPHDGALLVVSSSYNGTPPDNAAAFCRWLTGADDGAAAGVSYSVFGCGNTEWAGTYQAVPTLLDEQLAAHGARRVRPRGEGNAAGDFDAAYRDWHGGLWSDLAGALGLPAEVGADTTTAGPRLSVTLTNRQVTNPVVVSYQAQPATVLANRELITGADGKPPERSTRHLEIALAGGTAYRTGDHLGVLPRNGVDLVRRVTTRFGLDFGQYVTIVPNGRSLTHLPVDQPAPLLGVLGSCVELQDVAGRDHIATLARHTADPVQKAALEELTGDDAYRDRVHTPNRSVLDLLETFPACALPFAEFLDMLPPLRPRYYSISSSPLASPETCSITVGVLRGPARSGAGTFAGVSSAYLAALPENGTVFAFVRSPGIAFRPPDDPHTPMIMIGAGTGLAPFRGFLQERAAVADRGVPVGPALLFFGCRNQEVDLLYADELRAYQDRGLVRVENAFSRAADTPCRYVQDAMLDCADEVWNLLQRDAAVFVCGNASTIAPGVRGALTRIFRDRTGTGEADAAAWLSGLRSADRLVEDIWGG